MHCLVVAAGSQDRDANSYQRTLVLWEVTGLMRQHPPKPRLTGTRPPFLMKYPCSQADRCRLLREALCESAYLGKANRKS